MDIVRAIMFIFLCFISFGAIANEGEYELGIGLNKISYWSTQFPFVDLMKQASPWQDFQNRSAQIDVDKNDWVKSLDVGQTATTVFSMFDDKHNSYFTKAYVIYEGEGEIKYGGGVKKITKESKPNLDVIDLQSGNHLLTIIKTNPQNYLRNIRIIPFRFFESFQEGQIFNSDFLTHISGMKSLRYMDWMCTNNSKQGRWSSRPLVEHRTWSQIGVPLEVMIELSNITDSLPWFNIPHLADDEYVQNFGLMINRLLDKSLAIYFEHSNEVWNWRFEQAKYANEAKFNQSFLSDKNHMRLQWHGLRTDHICDVLKTEVFKTEPNRVKCVLGMQTVALAHYKYPLECPASAANRGCYRNIDYIGITTYFDGGISGSPLNNSAHNNTIRNWARKGAVGIDYAFEQLYRGSQLRQIEGYKNKAGVLADIALLTRKWKEIAKQYAVGLIAYEGGQHIAAYASDLINDPIIEDFYLAINRDARMGALYSDLISIWTKNGGGLHMFYLDIAPPSKYGHWGALEHVSQNTSPKWEAIKAK